MTPSHIYQENITLFEIFPICLWTDYTIIFLTESTFQATLFGLFFKFAVNSFVKKTIIIIILSGAFKPKWCWLVLTLCFFTKRVTVELHKLQKVDHFVLITLIKCP